ncbi:toprim domain-containing protein [Francisella hispaniensis]|uniref:DNA primase n=1 Tax=Francisella hispaniensis FSC454 TaxID=1088883 RepID=A0AAC9J7Z1_9GAMM|nr:toprim domain-containing protein [Francisella hispaniensis]APD50871.1 DNA primase [Francisella hispaniensis FSC454]KYW84133.1 DNA primase [Francisella hispaniensis FSC454]
MNITKFNDFINSIGYPLPNSFNYSIGIGELIRFSDKNKKNNNKNLWLKNIDNNIFVFGDWVTGEKYTYIDNDKPKYELQDFAELKKQREAIEKRQIEEINQKKDLATKLTDFYKSLPLANDDHPYLVKKGINNHPLIRLYKDVLIIPCFGTVEPFNNQIQSLQGIYPNGFKKFYKDAHAKGSCLILNKSSNDSFIFVEGFATGMSVLSLVERFKADISVICVFNCNNYIHVIESFYSRYPNAELNIWADKDKHGIGEKKAIEVAAAIPNIYINPPPLTAEQMDKGLSDWNDYLVTKGDL